MVYAKRRAEALHGQYQVERTIAGKRPVGITE
jgi:hypothetical protein